MDAAEGHLPYRGKLASVGLEAAPQLGGPLLLKQWVEGTPWAAMAGLGFTTN